jgi:hypothetical protein
MKHIFVAISLAFLSSSPVLASDEGEMSGMRKARALFSAEEDARLCELVVQYGAKRWDLIAENMPGRCASSCRGRWKNYLAPTINDSQGGATEERVSFVVPMISTIPTDRRGFFGDSDLWAQLGVNF